MIGNGQHTAYKNRDGWGWFMAFFHPHCGTCSYAGVIKYVDMIRIRGWCLMIAEVHMDSKKCRGKPHSDMCWYNILYIRYRNIICCSIYVEVYPDHKSNTYYNQSAIFLIGPIVWWPFVQVFTFAVVECRWCHAADTILRVNIHEDLFVCCEKRMITIFSGGWIGTSILLCHILVSNHPKWLKWLTHNFQRGGSTKVLAQTPHAILTCVPIP